MNSQIQSLILQPLSCAMGTLEMCKYRPVVSAGQSQNNAIILEAALNHEVGHLRYIWLSHTHYSAWLYAYMGTGSNNPRTPVGLFFPPAPLTCS